MQIGKYVVVRQLGAGAMGVVYLAEHPTLEQRVAIKLINSKLVGQRTVAERFFNEARAASQIGHPGIIGIYDFDVDESGSPFIVMEFLEGSDLGDHIRAQGTIDPVAIRDIGRQIADALAAAHEKRIIHRDLKPDNVFLSADAAVIGGHRAKILDFGIAKLTDATQMTQGGSLMGTPLYMSLEQTHGAEKVDSRSDIYSLGCILYEMATGQVPFATAKDLSELFEMHRTATATPANVRNPAIGAELSRLIAECMNKDPSGRPQSMTELGEQLAEAVPDTSVGERVVPDKKTVAPTDPKRFAETVKASDSGARAVAAEVAPEIAGVGGAETVVGSSKAPFVAGGAILLAAVAGLSIWIATKSDGENLDAAADPKVEQQAAAAIVDAGRDMRGWVRIPVPASPVALTVPKGIPEHQIFERPTLMSPPSAYEIQEHEVTVGEFMPWYFESPFKRELIYGLTAVINQPRAFLDHQISGMTLAAAAAYCESLSARLPSESEWEWAARGAEMRRHPWGSDAQDISLLGTSLHFPNVKSSRGDCTPEGVYDLAGSVWEMTDDTVTNPDDPKSLDRLVVIRGTNPQPDAPVQRDFTAVQRALICSDGPCASQETMLQFRGLTGFRCVR